MNKNKFIVSVSIILFVLCVMSASIIYASPYINVDYDDGSTTSTGASQVSGPTIHFHVIHFGTVTGATAYNGLNSINWAGQHGSEHADASGYESAIWHWVWNPALLTISGVEYGKPTYPPNDPNDPTWPTDPPVETPTGPPTWKPPSGTTDYPYKLPDFPEPYPLTRMSAIALPQTDGSLSVWFAFAGFLILVPLAIYGLVMWEPK